MRARGKGLAFRRRELLSWNCGCILRDAGRLAVIGDSALCE
jgi:hypothetical protein